MTDRECELLLIIVVSGSLGFALGFSIALSTLLRGKKPKPHPMMKYIEKRSREIHEKTQRNNAELAEALRVHRIGERRELTLEPPPTVINLLEEPVELTLVPGSMSLKHKEADCPYPLRCPYCD